MIPPNPQDTPRHPVRLAALRTGLTAHTLRAWERRYQVVAPSRSEGGQRLYSDLDVQRLKLLRRLTARGHGIAQLAGASLEELQRTAREHDVPEVRESKALPGEAGAEEFRLAVMASVRKLDDRELQAVLEKAAMTLGISEFFDTVVGPMLKTIGQGWSDGTVSIAQEHLASAALRRVLGWILRLYSVAQGAPRLVVATPPRHVHELGAMLAADIAASEGWDVTYLGPDIPMSEVLGSARQVQADAVALSVIYPKVDAGLIRDLDELRGGLDLRTPILLGGASAAEDRERLTSLGTQVMGSLDEFRASLRELRQPA
jgi:MerR family transcriptional regulator, light-induced transcriptional regulator